MVKYGPLEFVKFRWNAIFTFVLRISKLGRYRLLRIRFAKSVWEFTLWRLP